MDVGRRAMNAFGAMCLRIKESEYPPPEDAGPRTTLREKALHVVESLRISHYWYWALEGFFACLGGGVAAFGGFMMLSLVMTMTNIGIVNGLGGIITPICFLFVGSLVDRWHPVRVAGYGGVYGVFFGLGGAIWLFVDHPSPLVYMLTAVIGSVFAAPVGALGGTAYLPRVFALLPRDKFGQYNGAKIMVQAVGIFLGGIMGGLYLDAVNAIVPHHADDPNWAYRYLFIYGAVFGVFTAFCSYKIYRGWKRLGADKSYVPPQKPFRLADLPPHPDTDGKVHWGIIAFHGLNFLGSLICSIIWISYYIWWNPNPQYALCFGITMVYSIVAFLAFVRLVTFMERP